jgi:hypothetical protein
LGEHVGVRRLDADLSRDNLRVITTQLKCDDRGWLLAISAVAAKGIEKL